MKRNPVLYVFLIFLLFIPGVACGENTIDPVSGRRHVNSVQEMPGQLRPLKNDAFGFRPGYILSKKGPADESGFPEFFDLRKVDTDNDGKPDTSYVTSVKLQEPFGSCWGFAAISAAETSILSSGLAADRGLAAAADPEKDLQELNLSEKHVINFVNKPIMEEGHSQYREGFYFPGIEDFSEVLQFGGLTFYATSLFATGSGPVLESENELFEYHGKNEKIYCSSKYPICFYHWEDDWTIDDDLRWNQSFVLSGSNVLPSPAFTKTPEEWKAANNAIKEQLFAGHAVTIAYYGDPSMVNDEKISEYINFENWAQYTYDTDHDNHAVVIIGWDDRYPKENFSHKRIIVKTNDIGEIIEEEEIITPNPNNNGAWLVKNSWGSLENEFPNRSIEGIDWGLLQGQDTGVYNEKTGKYDYIPIDNAVNTGYFWLSYEDKSLQNPEVTLFDPAPASDEYRLEQYDYMPVQTVWAAPFAEKSKMANVFTAEEDSRLDYVSCQTTYPGTNVLYQVYRLERNSDDPTRGVMVAEASATYPWGGFHKIKLDKSPIFRKGERFSVVVTQETSDNKYTVSAQISFNESSNIEWGSGYYSKAVINPGESLVYIKGRWLDLSKPETRNEILTSLITYIYEEDEERGEDTLADYQEYYHKYLDIDNFPIKAWLKPLKKPDHDHTGVPAFFRLEGELPATGITNRSLLAEKPASVNYRPLGMELQIPTLNLSSEIVTLTPENGVYPVEWLGEQTGWLEGSALPGEGISVLAAHNTLNAEEYGPFALISTMEKGDRFSLLRGDGMLIMYEVYANEKIGADDLDVLGKTASAFENTLTLLTCEDERIEGGYASRRIVSARKLD
jgi:LPXTG-site transpeptidase (sortase) family protein